MKKIVSIITLFTIVMTLSCLFAAKTQAATLTPVKFDENTRYELANLYTEMPNTFEAVVNLDKNYNSNGVIFGNQYAKMDDYVKDAINFSIFSNGNPRIGYKLPSGEAREYIFTDVDVRMGRDVNVAIVRDSSINKISCYVDGELVGSYDADFEDFITTEYFCIGSDNRTWGSSFFKGNLKSLAVYSDARSESEIKRDLYSIDLFDENLMSYYDLSRVYDDVIIDKSGHGYNAIKTSLWLNETGRTFDYSYSIDIIGDTQMVTYYHPEKLANIYDYIVENVDKKKTVHVAGVGDITEKSTPTEWSLAASQIYKLNRVVPYSLVRGNHDDVNSFSNIFGADSIYKNQYIDRYSIGYANTVHEFSTDNLDYLLITLDFGASDSVLEWANKVVENHPYHNVIVSTHGYLDHYGGLIDKNYAFKLTGDQTAKNEGIDLWNKFISKHKNITMVFCGHIGYPDIILNQMVGENGNIVSQIQVDHQEYEYYNDATGMIATLYFTEDGKTVNVEYYSPIRNQYYRARNQFSFKVNTIEREVVSNDSGDVLEDNNNNNMKVVLFSSLGGLLAVSIFTVVVVVYKKKRK